VFRLIVVSLLLFFLGLTTVVAQDVEVATSIAFTVSEPRAVATGRIINSKLPIATEHYSPIAYG